MKSKRGNTILLYRKFNYCLWYNKKKGAKWRCPTQMCKAYIETNEYNEVIDGSYNHKHNPPHYYITNEGEYVRL